MMTFKTLRLAGGACALCAMLLVVPASAGAMDGHSGHQGHAMPHQSNTAQKQLPAEKELDAAMVAMHRDMAVPYTGDADADFIRGMIPHHQGALDMAHIVLKHGDGPEARQLARQIVRAQKAEIAWMRRWLERRQIPEKGEFHFNR